MRKELIKKKLIKQFEEIDIAIQVAGDPCITMEDYHKAYADYVIGKMPKEKDEWVNNKKKPTIAELEAILNDKGYEIAPDGSLRVKDREAIGYNQYKADLEKNLTTNKGE